MLAATYNKPDLPDFVYFAGSGGTQPVEINRAAVGAPTLSVIYKFRVLKALRNLYAFDAGWDGESAAKPRAEVVDQAISFLDRLSLNVQFRVTPDPDGSILLVLDRPDRDVILAFEKLGEITVHQRAGDYFSHEAVQWRTGTRIPPEISNLLGS